jgi:hypothetical protein
MQSMRDNSLNMSVNTRFVAPQNLMTQEQQIVASVEALLNESAALNANHNLTHLVNPTMSSS